MLAYAETFIDVEIPEARAGASERSRSTWIFWSSLPVEWAAPDGPSGCGYANHPRHGKNEDLDVSSGAVHSAKGRVDQPPILVVEDNLANQRVIILQLRHLGFAADVVSSGKAAIEKLTQPHGYQLVLMDIQMPGMDGITATRIIREWETAHDGRARIVAVTAGVTPEDKSNCLEAGMDDFLRKPLSLDALREALKSISKPD